MVGWVGVYLEPSLELTALKCYELPHLLTLGYCGGMGGVYLEPSLELV